MGIMGLGVRRRSKRRNKAKRYALRSGLGNPPMGLPFPTQFWKQGAEQLTLCEAGDIPPHTPPGRTLLPPHIPQEGSPPTPSPQCSQGCKLLGDLFVALGQTVVPSMDLHTYTHGILMHAYAPDSMPPWG